MIKIFLSHQSADSITAQMIAKRLKDYHNLSCYLDVIDPYINKDGEDLAEHIQSEMGKCTQLLAVVSEATKNSQWVPWEIGVATEKSFPLATFAAGNARPPEFLRKWPYLQNLTDIDHYATVSKTARSSLVRKRHTFSESYSLKTSTREFYSDMRRALGQ